MQSEYNKANWVQYVTMILVVVLIVDGLVMVNSVKNAIPEAPVIDIPTAQEIVDAADIPTAAEIAALIIIPEVVIPEVDIPEVDTSIQDRICEVTDGCQFWKGKESELVILSSTDARDDYREALYDLLDIDEDDEYISLDYPEAEYQNEYQVRAYTVDESEDWELKVLIRQEYTIQDSDVDSADWRTEVLYLVVTSVLDEGEYDSLTIEEVSRTFEFD